ncbi:MAG: metal-dependent transcriptional regulator [Bacteroidia bacterium]
MQRLTITEENYLKAIYKITDRETKGASTNAIAEVLETRAASVTDMLRKLSEKELIYYKKYQGVTLTETGRLTALSIVRRHRLWEVFLVQKLNFGWDEIHEIAEELEHVSDPKFIRRLAEYLGNPSADPHGDPIPTESGELPESDQILLSRLELGDKGLVIAVFEHSPAFLQYLDQVNLNLGKRIEVIDKMAYDQSMQLRFTDGRELQISREIAGNIYVKKQG